MDYQVKLANFEGPLELLLLLIEEQKVDIYDIPIARVTEQYIQYLKTMGELDLDVTSEFLQVAAELMDIKARMLVPPEEPERASEGEEEADPREELVRRLLEYRQFKEAAGRLQAREETQGRLYPRLLAEAFDLNDGSVLLDGVTLEDLMHAFGQVMAVRDSAAEPPVHSVLREEVSIDQKVRELRRQLERGGGRLSFSQLFPATASRLEVVVTFLAILELIRLREIRASQSQPFDEITLQLERQGEAGHET